MRAAKIFVNNTLAGILSESDDGSFVFRYDNEFFNDSSQSSISLTLPKTQQEFRSKTFFAFFANMLTEGKNRQIQSRKLKIDEEDDFGLLIATATNDTIGAITVEKMDYEVTYK